MQQRMRSVTYRERAAFYEIEHLTTEDRPMLTSLLGPSVTSVLEIPAGAGRNVEWWAQTGCRVTVADVEPRMVDRLRERIHEVGAEGEIVPCAADMRSFDLPMRFDLILVPTEGFQLIVDNDQALQTLGTFRRHLADSGLLYLDIALFGSATKEKSAWPAYYDPELADGVLIKEWTRALHHGTVLSRSRRQYHTDRLLVIDYQYTLTSPDGTSSRFRSRVQLRRYTYTQLLDLFRQANLVVRQVFQDYQGTPYRPGAGRLAFLLSP